jgi:hypothetical protein
LKERGLKKRGPKGPWTPEARAEMGRRAKGPKSAQFRLDRAEDVRNGIAGYRCSKRGAFTDRKGRTFNMRSEWERATAAWLDEKWYNWDYEPVSLSLPSGRAYVPDFRLENGWFLEIKGYFSPVDREKIAEARAAGHRAMVWGAEELYARGVLSRSYTSKESQAGFESSISRRPRGTCTKTAS